MTSKDLEAIFAPLGTRVRGALFFEERAALALIDEAQRHDVAIVGIDQFRASEGRTYSALAGHTLAVVRDRVESWRQAREFVAYFSGTDVLFEVVLEAPGATHRARVRDRTTAFGFWRPRFVSVFLSVMMILFLLVWLIDLAGM